jgi:RanBP-type and C3HC4-type zinc finger-containing protein 1
VLKSLVDFLFIFLFFFQPSLTISFADDFLPIRNLNNVFIDLTQDSPLNVKHEPMEEDENGNELRNETKNRKTITLSLGLGLGLNETIQRRITRSTFRNNNPSTSHSVQEQLNEAASSWAFENQAGPSHRGRPSEPCYQKLLEMNNKPLIENYENFICILCKLHIGKCKGVMLKDCLHSFCRPCLIRCIKETPPEKCGIVACPYTPEKCDSVLSVEEIKTLLGASAYQKFREEQQENSAGSLLPILLQMDDLDLIPNYQAFECSICFSDIAVGEGIVLKNCLHFGCKNCLAELIKHAEEFEVCCPNIVDGKNCMETITEREMKSLVSEAIFDKHLKKSLKIAEHANAELNFHCRGLNCENFVEIANPEITSFQCNSCHQINCVPCKAIHTGKSCQDYQEEVNPEIKNNRLMNENKQSEDAIAADIANGNAMKCPRCLIPVMKIAGCDYITCTACKLGICWVTKKPRKSFQRTNGEVVEGCKCNEPPTHKRCHPKCGNCH